MRHFGTVSCFVLSVSVSLVGTAAAAAEPSVTVDPESSAILDRVPTDNRITLVKAFAATSGFDPWTLWSGATQLRGVNIWQRRVYVELDGSEFLGAGPLGPPFVQKDFDDLAALGANWVNISHPGLYTEIPPYELDEDVQNNLDALLEMIEKADLFATISFRTGPGRSEFTFYWGDDGDWFDSSYYNDEVWRDQAAQDAWATMWRYTADRYKNNAVVVGYDLMVEPNSNEVWLDEWDPETFYAQHGDSLYDWNQMYPAIVTSVREVDTMTPILIGCMAYSAVDWLGYMEPLSDTRVVYAVHQYQPMVYTHQSPPLNNTYPGTFDTDWDGQADQFDRTWIDTILQDVDSFKSAHNVPVAANEFGVYRWEPSGDDFMADQMQLFEQRNMNHALWAWDASWAPWSSEEDAFNFRHGPDPSNHTSVPNDLQDAITAQWSLNTMRPSTVGNGGTTPDDCEPSDTVMCLNDSRFKLEVTWEDFESNTGDGIPVTLTDDTGYFWFFNPANVELVVKVLDGRVINSHFWVFYGALSNVEYTITVTDTDSGTVKVYTNPSGNLASVADTSAFYVP